MSGIEAVVVDWHKFSQYERFDLECRMFWELWDGGYKWQYVLIAAFSSFCINFVHFYLFIQKLHDNNIWVG